METWKFAIVGLGLGVVGCFGKVSDGDAAAPFEPATTSAPVQTPPAASATSQGSEGTSTPGNPAPPSIDARPAPSEAGCASDAGSTCGLADGQPCEGDQDCKSGMCFANGNVGGGICSEYCSEADEATVCTFGEHQCSDATSGMCM